MKFRIDEYLDALENVALAAARDSGGAWSRGPNGRVNDLGPDDVPAARCSRDSFATLAVWTQPKATLALIAKFRAFVSALSPCDRCQLDADWGALHSIDLGVDVPAGQVAPLTDEAVRLAADHDLPDADLDYLLQHVAGDRGFLRPLILEVQRRRREDRKLRLVSVPPEYRRVKRRDVRDGEIFYYVERYGDPSLGHPGVWYRLGPARPGQPTAFGSTSVVEALPTEHCGTPDLDVVVVWSPR